VTGQRVAVVTGAARGIGAAVVRRLAGDGWAVVAIEPEEVASVVAWACSPEASAVTGSVLHADGGFTG
jgi:NAD(P)-dependent dehydrogenase (short-subunit alcohol dehydrogenase family)